MKRRQSTTVRNVWLRLRLINRYYENSIMPTKPLRLCKHAKCTEWTSNSYCEKHMPVAIDNRESSTARGYDTTWRKARKRYLQSNPLCVECERQGKTVPANEVDHIIPHKSNYRLMWDEDNWQALCKQCHSRKTATEDGAFGNKKQGNGWFN